MPTQARFLATVGMVLYGMLTQNLAAAEEDTLYIEARKDIEKMLDKKVFLATPVKVKKNWRNDKSQLKKFGYQ